MTDSAKSSYGGYEYQLLVSAWIALDLIIARSLTTSIEVEPASEEDIAAELNVNPDSASARIHVRPDRRRFEIQIKKHSRMWTSSQIRKLIETPKKRGKRGPRRRTRVSDRFAGNPDLYYTLVTNAQVATNARHWVVKSIGDKPSVHNSAKPELEHVSVLEQKIPRLIEYEIDSLLELSARVPLQHVVSCRAELIEAIRSRLLGLRPKRFDDQELIRIIKTHGGMSPQATDLFVAPASFPELSRRLDERPFALILVGPPGIGKTLVAETLVDEYLHRLRPFEILKDPTVSEARAAIRSPGQTLLYLEDPWGRYRRISEGDAWTDELPRLIREANGNPDKRFLITSRSGILADSININPAGDTPKIARQLGAYVGMLTEADFDAKRRVEILRLHMRDGERWQQDWVHDVASEVVADLTVPQALATFAQRVRSLAREHPRDLAKMISESRTDAIASTVSRQIREHHAFVESAIVLWIFLGTTESLTPLYARDLSTHLTLHGGTMVDVEKLASYMEANGWIAVNRGQFAAHPTVIEALEKVVEAEPAKAHLLIQAVLSALIDRKDIEVAARLIWRLHERLLPIPDAVRNAVENHLRNAILVTDDVAFPRAVEMLVRVSKAQDPVSLFVRALTTTEQIHGFGSWISPKWTQQETETVRMSLDAEKVARRWIRLSSYQHRTLLNEEVVVQFLGSLGWDLTEDFTAAAVDSLSRDFVSEIALLGALRVPKPQFDRLLDAALQEYQKVEVWFSTDGLADQRRAEECELNADYSAHVVDEPSERFGSSSRALELIVGERRQREGFNWLLGHPRVALLVDAWAAAIPSSGGEQARDELVALLNVSDRANEHRPLETIGRARCKSLTNVLLKALVDGPFGMKTAAWTGLFGLYTAEELPEVIRPALSNLDWVVRGTVLFSARSGNIDQGDHFYHDPKPHRVAALSVLSASERAAIEACLAVQGDEPACRILDTELFVALSGLTAASDDLLASLAVVAIARTEYDSTDAIQRLVLSEDKWARLHTLRGIAAIVPLDRTLMRRAFEDSFYQCRRFAMYTVANSASSEDRTDIIAMAEDRSAPVREACAQIIGEGAWMEGLMVLCDLLSDRRDRSQSAVLRDGMPDYHVARKAARSLQKFTTPLPRPIFDRILNFLNAGSNASDDIVVHVILVSVFAAHPDESVPPLIKRLFRSGRRAGGPSGTFPLRYAAAWAWLNHLSSYPGHGASIPSDDLVSYATHSDSRLAAPALLSLGMSSNTKAADIEKVVHDSGTTADRALLLDAGARMGGKEISDNLFKNKLRPGEPGRQLLNWCWDTSTPQKIWKQRLKASKEVREWLDYIRRPDPVSAALRLALLSSPRARLLGNVSIDDLRNDELPETMPVLSSFNLAGLE
jgi:hypothetical protein